MGAYRRRQGSRWNDRDPRRQPHLRRRILRAFSLEAKPAQGTRAYVIEETLPKGWSIVDAGEGSFDETTGTLRFGPYFGDTGRTLEYVVQAPADSHGITVFKAAGSFDGIEVRADGAWMVQSGGVRVPNSSASR